MRKEDLAGLGPLATARRSSVGTDHDACASAIAGLSKRDGVPGAGTSLSSVAAAWAKLTAAPAIAQKRECGTIHHE
jgi:hypothetical protein